jgi:hypothetical protein
MCLSTADVINLGIMGASLLNTVAIVALTVVISKRQETTARETLRFQHFEKRFEAFAQISEFFREVRRHGELNLEADVALREGRQKSRFDSDINDFIAEVDHHRQEMSKCQRVLRGDSPAGSPERIDAHNEKEKHLEWIRVAGEGMEKRYEPYLKMKFR